MSWNNTGTPKDLSIFSLLIYVILILTEILVNKLHECYLMKKKVSLNTTTVFISVYFFPMHLSLFAQHCNLCVVLTEFQQHSIFSLLVRNPKLKESDWEIIPVVSRGILEVNRDSLMLWKGRQWKKPLW